MDDPVERRLLQTLELEPRDPHARHVYADWLEERGYATRATFLRLDAVDDTPMDELATAAQPLDAAWRAEVSRAKVSRCVTFAFACTKRWAELARKDRAKPNERYCGACGKTVTFVATIDEAHALGAAAACIAIDPAVARGDLERAYDDARRPMRPPPMMGMVAPFPREPPVMVPVVPPQTPPSKKSMLHKIRGWFGK